MNDIIFFDLETTGTSTTKDSIVELATVKVDYNLNILESKRILINPKKPIPKEASDVHGITDEFVSASPAFDQYSKSLFKYFTDGDPIIAGFNSNRFDVPLLSEEFARCGLLWPSINQKYIDCYKIYSSREKRDLTSALKFYTGIDLQDAHDALNDVKATVEVLRGQISMYSISVDEIVNECTNNDFVDIEGKIILINNIPCYNFGKDKGHPIFLKPDYAYWMLKNEFSSNTKNVLRSILSNENISQ